jgi:hypothetical protein
VKENCTQKLVRKPEGKRPLGRSGHLRQYNIKIDLKVTGWEGEIWIHRAQDRD